MKMKDVLILREKSNQYFLNYINDNIQPIFKERKGFIKKCIFKVLYMMDGIFVYPFFEKWKYSVKNYKKIILFDTNYRRAISKYIKKKNKDCKILVYYWNIIDSKNKYILNDKNIDEIWTFDSNDAKKYNIFFNPQFYTNKIKLNKIGESIDVLFIGKNKGRKEELEKLENKLNQLGIKTKFIIFKDKSRKIISYDKYLYELAQARAVLDYSQNSQVGLTLRVMESIFLEKKLITNNKDISQYDFYKKNNIFILGSNDFSKIKKFISEPYKKIDNDVINKYDFYNWIKRFNK